MKLAKLALTAGIQAFMVSSVLRDFRGVRELGINATVQLLTMMDDTVENDTKQTGSAKPNRRLGNRKSKQGCLTCKTRKVKCDETHPYCKRSVCEINTVCRMWLMFPEVPE